jgi:spore germination cell wall hydrolase CwlJ-like protein
VGVLVPVSHRRRRHKLAAGFGALVFALIPSTIGFGDLGALLARQPGVTARAHKYLIASPFGTIHAATFSMPRPIGTAIPHPPVYALANFDPTAIAASIGAQLLGDPTAPLQFPTVNRRGKRDSLISRARQPMPPLPPALPIEPVSDVQAEAPLKNDEAAGRFDPYSEYEFAAAPDEQPAAPDAGLPHGDVAPAKHAAPAPGPRKPKNAAQVYFGAAPIAAGEEAEAMQPWAPGEAPVVKTPTASGDPDIKLAALNPSDSGADKGGESIANKGEVTGVDQRPKSPAERLALEGDARAKADKCLANAVYFEARGESVRGQIAVAQVVMNRVFSPFYPNDVCGVVYQNANRRFACQFTFACDGEPDVVTEPDAWLRAVHIARDMLDGKLWMPEVEKATHYHAYWVHPDWVNEMKKIYKLGVHTFYRPRAWGDGADEPTWGDAKATRAEAAQVEREWPVSHSREWLRSEEGQAFTRKNARN